MSNSDDIGDGVGDGAKDTAAHAMTRSSAMTNALDFVTWWRGSYDEVVVAATHVSSSSSLGSLCSGQDEGARAWRTWQCLLLLSPNLSLVNTSIITNE